ncbi:glycoside hydrolase family 5 protein [Sphingobium yanoikuyae]|nr:glycoside hydrolase family 5 protein [Sphingobium yanoikuyae]
MTTPTPTPSPTPTPTPTPTFPYTPAAAARATTGLTLPVGKCINMGNQLEAPVEGSFGRKIRQSDFPMIAAAGFRTVRIPIRFSSHAATSPPYAIDATFMKRVRQVVQWASDARLNAIIDMHHYDEIHDDPAGQKDRFVAMWRQIAEEFFNAPDSVWFELLNEPRGALTNATLPAIYVPALAAIRATNLARAVIINGGGTSHIDSLSDLPMPNDPYVVPTFHYYEPFAFTHQGATYITPTPPFGVAFGSAADYSLIDRDLQRVRNYMQRTGRVPFVGEYGAIQDIPLDQRALYYGTISHAFASIGIQSCAWSFTNTFHLSNDNGWITAITNTIATTTD